MCEGADQFEPAADQRFPPQARLRRQSEIRAVFELGTRRAGRLLALVALRGTQETRAIVVTGRKVGGAVARNRARRLLREAYRLNRRRVSEGCHLALVARTACAQASRSEVEAELLRLLEEMGCSRPAVSPDCSPQAKAMP